MSRETEVTMAERLRSHGMLTPTPTPELLTGMRAIGERMAQEWATRAGPDGQRALEAYRAALR
jgi:TRAP-type C4-dicarboxylate transport system substrate-binding protein